MLKSCFLTLITALSIGCAWAGQAHDDSKPDVVLSGEVKGSQQKTYFEIPFIVPAGVHRISVDFSYTGRDQKTALDLGIADPERFRGNSGGNKQHFTIAEADATPSYLPGSISPGTWRLLISVPNIRAKETSKYTAEVRFNGKVEDAGFTLDPLSREKRWYRGDLHMHTAHSDASCASESGKRVPCPVFLTLQTAKERGLDFIAITDHNATSQYEAMRELQPYFDKLLLIPGREITTFWGHFNIFGITQYVDYRAETGKRDVNAIVRDVQALGGIASINHAASPDGEVCMGCGWKPSDAVDMALFTGVEVMNGSRLSSAKFWDAQLAKGARLTGIGGSDNHNGSVREVSSGPVGVPETVVQADALSVPAILEGIRLGRVFIDLTGSTDKTLEIEAQDETGTALMGGELTAPAGASVIVRITLNHCPHAIAHLLVDGAEPGAALANDSDSGALHASWKSDGARHWIRAEIRDTKGNLMLISNPIYINWTKR